LLKIGRLGSREQKGQGESRGSARKIMFGRGQKVSREDFVKEGTKRKRHLKKKKGGLGGEK